MQAGDVPSVGRIRRLGAGRESLTACDPRLLEVWEEMIDGQTRGDPPVSPAVDLVKHTDDCPRTGSQATSGKSC